MALGGTQVAAMFGVLELKDNMSAGLDNAMNKMHEMSTAGKVMRGGLLVGAAGATALAAGLGVAIDEAMEAQVNIAKLDAVIKATGGIAGVTSKAAQDLATSLSRVTRFSDDAIIQGETMLLTFKEIGEDTFPRATEAMLDIAEMMGTDSVTAATLLGKALNDPIQGVTALRRYGVQLTEAQEEQIKSFMAVNDVASAQAVILGEVEAQFGGIARAAGDTLAGKITIAKNAMLDFAEGIGMKLIPYIESAGSLIATKLPEALDAIGEAWDTGGLIAVGQLILENIGKGIGDAAAWTKKTIIDPIQNAILDLVYPGRGFFTEPYEPEVTPIWNMRLFEQGAVAMTAQSGPVPIDFTPQFPEAGGLAVLGQRLLDALTAGIGDVAGWANREIVQPIVTALTTTDWAGVLATAESTLGDIMDALATGWDDFSGWVKTNILYPTVEWILAQDWAGALATGTAVLSRIMDAIGGAWNDFKKWITDKIITPIADELGGITTADWIGANVEIGNTITKILDAMIAGIIDFGKWVYDNVITKIAAELAKGETWKKAFDAAVTVVGGIGGVLLGAITIFATVGVWAIERLGELAQALIDAVPSAVTKLAEFGKKIAEEIWKAIKSEVTSWPGKISDMLLGGGEGDPYGGMLHTGEPGIWVGLGAGTVFIGAGPAPHKQHGGPVFAQQNYLVGERGPELFVPSTPGTIVPNHALGGQTIIIQAVYIQDEDPQRWLDRLTDAARMRGSQVVPVM